MDEVSLLLPIADASSVTVEELALERELSLAVVGSFVTALRAHHEKAVANFWTRMESLPVLSGTETNQSSLMFLLRFEQRMCDDMQTAARKALEPPQLLLAGPPLQHPSSTQPLTPPTGPRLLPGPQGHALSPHAPIQDRTTPPHSAVTVRSEIDTQQTSGTQQKLLAQISELKSKLDHTAEQYTSTLTVAKQWKSKAAEESQQRKSLQAQFLTLQQQHRQLQHEQQQQQQQQQQAVEFKTPPPRPNPFLPPTPSPPVPQQPLFTPPFDAAEPADTPPAKRRRVETLPLAHGAPDATAARLHDAVATLINQELHVTEFICIAGLVVVPGPETNSFYWVAYVRLIANLGSDTFNPNVLTFKVMCNDEIQQSVERTPEDPVASGLCSSACTLEIHLGFPNRDAAEVICMQMPEDAQGGSTPYALHVQNSLPSSAACEANFTWFWDAPANPNPAP